MTTIACTGSSQALLPHAVPVRSGCTSTLLAEVARQRRGERCQRRELHARRAAWFALFNRDPFESVRTHATPGIVFAGPMPLVYALPQS